MEFTTVPGKYDKHQVKIYTISTCMWCKLLKRKLKDNKIKYSYLDIDLLPLSDKTQVKSRLREYRRILAFPMMFVNDVFIPNQDIDSKIRELIQDA
ncbi:MAG: glutaredoxin family protein [Candidatus Hodarchaeota archaeon]